jgi:hypothetical protein
MRAAPGAGRARLILLQDTDLNQGVKEQIHALGSRFPIERIVEIVESNFQVKVSRDQIFALRAEGSAPQKPAAPAPDHGGPDDQGRPDKESVQIAADAVPESLVTFAPEPALPPFSIATDAPPTRTRPGQEQDSPEPIAAVADAQADMPPTRTGPGQESDAPEPIAADAPPHAQVDMPPTRTGPGPETEPHELLPTEVREFVIGCMARRAPPSLIAADVLRKFGFEMDLDEINVCWRDRDELMAQGGPGGGPGSGSEKVSRPKLSDEIKEFIVKRIACYETPSRVAAAVRINFGIDVDRRRIFDYNPKSSRPPAQRWIDLHDATRARFLREVSEIGVAQNPPQDARSVRGNGGGQPPARQGRQIPAAGRPGMRRLLRKAPCAASRAGRAAAGRLTGVARCSTHKGSSSHGLAMGSTSSPPQHRT